MAATAVLSPSSILSPYNSPPENETMEHEKHEEIHEGGRSPSGVFLVKKMITVLHDMGYSETSQERVAGLVFANFVNATVLEEDLSGDASTALCQTLLDEKILQQRDLRLNSNEPVLLVEGPQQTIESGQLETVKAEVLASLRAKGVKPVRVYTRLSTSEGVETEMKALLLNVVNTDIGGPSMVQLLDAAFHGKDWKQELLSKEAWNGYDRIWQDQVHQQPLSTSKPDAIVETFLKAPKMEVAESRSEPTPQVSEALNSTNASTADPPIKTSPVHINPESDDEEPEVFAVEHPDMKALRESEMRRAAVRHPTWDRSHEGQSLLDIITTQSAGVTDTDPISVIAISDVGEERDDFEVVEKP